MVDEPKKEKRTRAPSAYNKFIGEQIRAGKTFSEAVQAWNTVKKGSG
jgi:hypothetical protein